MKIIRELNKTKKVTIRNYSTNYVTIRSYSTNNENTASIVSSDTFRDTTRNENTASIVSPDNFRNFIVEKYIIEVKHAKSVLDLIITTMEDSLQLEELTLAYQREAIIDIKDKLKELYNIFESIEKNFMINYLNVDFYADLNDICKENTQKIESSMLEKTLTINFIRKIISRKEHIITLLTEYIAELDYTIKDHFTLTRFIGKKPSKYLNTIAENLNEYDDSIDFIPKVKINFILEKLKELKLIIKVNKLQNKLQYLWQHPYEITFGYKSEKELIILHCMRQLSGLDYIIELNAETALDKVLKTEGFLALYEDFILSVESLKVLD